MVLISIGTSLASARATSTGTRAPPPDNPSAVLDDFREQESNSTAIATSPAKTASDPILRDRNRPRDQVKSKDFVESGFIWRLFFDGQTMPGVFPVSQLWV